jgi:hypothetical protein
VLDDRAHDLDVADARHVAQRNGLVGQERGGERGQRLVLVAAGDERAGQAPAFPSMTNFSTDILTHERLITVRGH